VTAVYLTIDTEYAAALAGLGRAENFARSIDCVTPAGSVGIGYQMDLLDRWGHKAVFFVDPMPALVWGVAAIADVVGPIIERGHDVQLHLHTEWLELAGADNPLGGRIGQNLRDFNFEEQCLLLEYARATLIEAGAPKPVAFRAGNYGANDDTLRALAEIGIGYDTSHCPGLRDGHCRIELDSSHRTPLLRHGVVEVPIGCIATNGGGLRHAQITALTYGELVAAILHARDQDTPFTIVSHSFELLSRDRSQINQIVARRFRRFCEELAQVPGASTATYSSSAPRIADSAVQAALPYSLARTGRRLAEQAVANVLYGYDD